MKCISLLALLGACVAAPTDDLSEDAEAISGCTSVTTVLLYSEDTYDLQLPGAFAAAQDRCTRYYVDLPHDTPDATMPRAGADKVHALGPNFHAMAEFSWGAWRQWIEASPGTRSWRLAGEAFRARMAAAGYDVAHGDTWIINEFPSTTRTGELDVWTHEREAVRALAADGTQGGVFVIGMGGDLTSWLAQTDYWSDMARAVRFFSHEVYADPHHECTGDVAADSAHLNPYLERLPIEAAAGGAATAAAHAYLDRAYVPLVSSAWNSNVGFGNDIIPLDQFERFSRLQIYATHVFAADHAYPGRRLGFAWAPKQASDAELNELSGIIARSFARAYPAGHFQSHGKYACSVNGGLDDCACSVAPGPTATSM